MTAERSPHPAPPPASGPSGAFVAWMALLVVTALITLTIGVTTGSVPAWTVFASSVTLLVISGWAARLSSTGDTAALSPRTKRELRYAGRTAERAGIWWDVNRALNGLFGRRAG